MKLYWTLVIQLFLFLISSNNLHFSSGQDYDDDDDTPATPPPGIDKCAGVFLSYAFTSRDKEFPHLKNASAQAWAFKSMATIMNLDTVELKGWKMYVGFHHREVLVSVTNAVVTDGYDLPATVSNGTTLGGYPNPDLKTPIDTAGDWNQITNQIEFTGTVFGGKEKDIPMPKNISLVMDGYKCPKPTKYQSYMYACCKRDPKFKLKPLKGKYAPRQYGDLNIAYDVTASYEGSYQAQVTIDNVHPLGRLDHWNLTWEWMRGEFIKEMKGAYTREIDYSDCIYGNAAKVLQGFDFSEVMNCQKTPIISDLPATMANNTDKGKVPGCCRNGTLLPQLMDPSKSQSVFQLRVYKLPPDTAQTVLYPPQRWNITGDLNPHYKCGSPIRVDPTEFPDPDGLPATKAAIASWQIVCNISRPSKDDRPKCCVSFSAYYNSSAVPCSTCACGCDDIDTSKCNPDGKAMLVPSEALLVPFVNRTAKAKAWASLKHFKNPKRLPCPDNCGVSINWHLDSNTKTGWSARITLFNWGGLNFEDWFAAVRLDKTFKGYENIYSFNGTKIESKLDSAKNTVFFQGLKGLNFLVGIKNDSNPPVPGKQQSVISFTKKEMKGIDLIKLGAGFPNRVYFNGEECAIPSEIPRATADRSRVNLLLVFLLMIFSFVITADRFH